MEVKTFIEKKKIYNPVRLEVSEVESRCPELVEDDGKTIGFRYFDLVNEEAINYSPWIYFGEILTIDDIKAQYKNVDVLISNMQNKGIYSLCKTTPGYFMTMNDGDMTYEEYKNNFKSRKR